MKCRAGISTESKERKKAWEKQVVGFRNWRIFLSNVSREEAQAKEEVLVKGGCEGSSGRGVQIMGRLGTPTDLITQKKNINKVG